MIRNSSLWKEVSKHKQWVDCLIKNVWKFGLKRRFQRAALENLAIVLKASGSGLEHIVKVNIYLANMPRDFQAMNAIYAEVS